MTGLSLIPQNPQSLIRHVRERLTGNGLTDNWWRHGKRDGTKGSAVLLLLTLCSTAADGSHEPCLLLNKRSRKVLQPGDLCYPGGGVERLDTLLSGLLRWPFSPFRKWPAWSGWKTLTRRRARRLSLFLTTALRESWEEMHLNPLKVAFLGPLPVQKLVLFNRRIHPLVGWAPPNQRLVPNWEVERIVTIPLPRLLEARHYARYRLSYKKELEPDERTEDFPCYIHRDRRGTEILWGATFRITLDFLNLVFGFRLPVLTHTPVIERRLDGTYLNGSSVEAQETDALDSEEML